MQKIYNQKEKMVDESIEGFVKCYNRFVSFAGNTRALRYTKAPINGKVGIATGGGYGHDPAFMGYLGENMLDAVAIGDVFQPPSVDSFYAAFEAADSGKGVVCLYGNYPADIKNANEAIALAAKKGITVKSIIANDDVAASDPMMRIGSTGEVILWKIGGAAASLGYNLYETAAVAQKALDRTRSIGIGIASCIIPEEGRPNYLIETGTMEIGIGHHGQSSRDTCKLKSAEATADLMLNEILKDLPINSGDKVVVMISGLGNTMLSEMNILYSRIHDLLSMENIKIHKTLMGNFFTSLDMMGVTLTILNLDEELTRLFDLPAYPVSLKCFV